jgi:hypothetical protein
VRKSLKSAIKKVNKWFLLTGLSFLPSFWDNHPAAEPPDRYATLLERIVKIKYQNA